MTWTDETGTVHPSGSDEVTAAGLEHIDHCDRCKQRMPWLTSEQPRDASDGD
jgi:hypothetical protein